MWSSRATDPLSLECNLLSLAIIKNALDSFYLLRTSSIKPLCELVLSSLVICLPLGRVMAKAPGTWSYWS